MAITFVAEGTRASGTGSVTPGEPAGIQADDFLLLAIEGEGEDASADAAPTGGDWTLIGTVASGEDSLARRTRLTLYWHIYDGTTSPSYVVPDAGTRTLATVYAFRGVDTTTPIHKQQSTVDSGADTSMSATGVTTTIDNCMIVVVMGIGDDASISGWTNSSWDSLTSLSIFASTAGSDGSIATAYGILSTAGASGTTTATLTASEEEANWTIALAPASAGTNTNVPLNAGSYTLTGNALAADLSSALAAGSYTLTGYTLAAPLSRTIGLDASSYTLTGYSATINADRFIDLAAGSYTITGQELTVSTVADTPVALNLGSYALTGQALTVTSDTITSLDAGSYGLTGHNPTITIPATSTSVPLGVGAYTLRGYSAHGISLVTGSYSLTGYDATVAEDVATVVPLDVGAYSLTGHALTVDIPTNTVVSLGAGAYLITGNDLGLQLPTVITLDAPDSTPRRRTAFVAAENRTAEIAAENRTAIVPRKSRAA